ncbi:hypothetical protein N1851_019380 [Merluccius polli]|uniref:Uncharacterized protein n=1 Tax=Merluccius polli TaxID=89951 RepID=A0AA47MMB7_MERPO|nr:hypothetical protein N1851_019380 [Merluccius polli]
MADVPAEKVDIPALRTKVYTVKQAKKRKTDVEKRESKRESDNGRNKSCVNIGQAYPRWRELRDSIGLMLDSELADLLLDRDDDFSVAGVGELEASPDDLSLQQLDASMTSLDLNTDTIDVEEFNDIKNSIIDWADDTWCPAEETESVSSLQEEETTDDDSDSDYVPPFCVGTGGALKSRIHLDELPAIRVEDTVHDSSDVGYTHTDVSGSPQAQSDTEVIGQPASITYHHNLKMLAEYLLLPINMCTAKDPVTSDDCQAPGPFHVWVKSRATAAIIQWICPSGHTVWQWSSQSSLKYGMQIGDFMLATNILLSGNNYAKVALLFKFMNMGMVGRSTFFKIQDSYCVDTIKQFWEEKRREVVPRITPKPSIVVLGDGRMDSPGFSAQYCTYSVMENDSKEIISIKSVDKRETARNSVIMEKEAFIRTFTELRQEVENLSEICTDAHSQIAALFTKGIYKSWGVRHTLDMWHGSKNLGKKIHKAGQQKGCSILLIWSKDICNHFWFCCKMAATYDEFFDMWAGILHHVTGVHEWALGACHHGPLSENRDKDWIQKGSVAHDALNEVVLDERWLREVVKFLGFRSTAELESFHNHILMYASKRFSFTPPVYSARTLLAGLDYNYNVHRPVQRKSDGSIGYGKVFNKKSRKWSLYTMKVDYAYIPDLQKAILRSRTTAHKGMPRQRTLRPDDPRQLGVLCGVPPPSTEELLKTHISRGQSKELLDSDQVFVPQRIQTLTLTSPPARPSAAATATSSPSAPSPPSRLFRGIFWVGLRFLSEMYATSVKKIIY